mgnify:CR=1 FL=1
MIPMVDLKAQYRSLQDTLEPAMLTALEATQFILGPNVQAFEKEAAAYLGVEHAVGVASGTDALHLALIAAGVGAGDEVITTPFTFIATAEAIDYVGATPVFVDIDPRTFNLDLNAVESAITPKTRAVIPVHLFGQPVNMVELMELCVARDLHVVEDCAQSFGATVETKNGSVQTGAFGDAGCFSFFPSKNLGCFGDGGLVTTNSSEIAEQLKSLRNHGSKVRYYHSEIGYNSRLDELQAVVLRAKLPQIDNYNQNRRRVAAAYAAGLEGLPVEIPFEDGFGTHVYHQYTLLSEQRENIMEALAAADIAHAIYYPVPLHQQEVFADSCHGVSLPVTEQVAAQCLSLPIYPELEGERVEQITDVIRSVF